MIEVRGDPLGIKFPPEFTEGESTTRQVAEHQGVPIRLWQGELPFPYPTSQAVGEWVRATDRDGDRLYYFRVAGDSSKFQVDRRAGRIGTRPWCRYIHGSQTEARGFIDYEAQTDYRLKLMVHDAVGGSDYIDVSVEIIEVAEPPLGPATPKITPVPGSLTARNVGRTAPDNTGRPAITGHVMRYREKGETDRIDGPRDVSGASPTIGGLDMETSYAAQVRATNKDGGNPWSSTAKGATPPPTTPTLRFAESSYGVSEPS